MRWDGIGWDATGLGCVRLGWVELELECDLELEVESESGSESELELALELELIQTCIRSDSRSVDDNKRAAQETRGRTN